MSFRDEEDLAELLRGLGNKIRLRIISELAEKPMNVYELSERIGESYPLTFLHLKRLKRLGLLREVRREESPKGLLPIRYYAPTEFEVTLTPENIRSIVRRKRGE